MTKENSIIIKDRYLINKDSPDEGKQEIDPNFPEGLYFNMGEKQYHKLKYFSRSLSETTIFDLEEVKYLEENPPKQTPAMALGTAIHSMFLETKIFDNLYLKYPSSEDYKGKTILKTLDDLKEFLKDVGENQSGVKAKLIPRVKEYLDPEKFIIWDEEIDFFNKYVETNNKRILRGADFETIQGIRKSFAKRKKVKEIISNGFPEVAIIWKDEKTGIMCKCLLDYLRPEAIGEVKSFSVKYTKGLSLYEYLCEEIKRYHYNYQFFVYQMALEIIIKKIRCNKAKVYDAPCDEWMNQFLAQSIKEFYILFVRTAAPYQMKAIGLNRADTPKGSENDFYTVSRDNWRLAINKYSTAIKTNNWTEKEVEILHDAHVSNIGYQASIY